MQHRSSNDSEVAPARSSRTTSSQKGRRDPNQRVTTNAKAGATKSRTHSPQQITVTQADVGQSALNSGGLSLIGAWAISLGVFLLTVVDLPTIDTSPWAPEAAVALVVGVAGVPVLAARALGRGVGPRFATETRAARLAVCFVLAGALSTVLSPTPLAIFGTYSRGTGLIFIVIIVGWWALGTGMGTRGRQLLENALIAGAIANATLAILQQLFGLSSIGLAGNSGQPDGFLGNPVFLGELLTASLALLAPRFKAEPLRWWLPVGVVAIGLGVDGERSPALLAFVVVGWVVISAWSNRRNGYQDADSLWRRSLMFGGLVIAAIGIGSVAARLLGGLGVISHTASSASNETFGERFHAWIDALHAVSSHPLLGYGPGQFRAATSPYYTLSDIRVNAGSLLPFTDAHNFLVEYATTTGLVGVGFLIAWLAVAVWARSGPLLGFAAVIGAMSLIEPLNIVTIPLALVALGAAVPRADSPMSRRPAKATSREPAQGGDEPATLPRWVGPAALGLSVLAIVPALYLVIGDAYFDSAFSRVGRIDPSAAERSVSTASRLLAPWPDPAQYLSMALSTSGAPGQLAQAERWAKVAVNRDPTNAVSWSTLAQIQGESGNPAAAKQSALKAIGYAPWYPPALNVLGVVSALQHNYTAAERWFEDSLQADPNQNDYQRVLADLEAGCTVPPSAGASRLELTCPP